jgi:8-oxo-dGTP pyrophosphatase MutT (NUDIX family)
MSDPYRSGAAPRDAATVVLLRDGEEHGSIGPEVLMVKRNRGASFMADAHVFPGGRLEESDGGDFAFAAAREAFEEAGVLLAVDEQGRAADNLDPAWLEAGRIAVGKGEVSFNDLLAQKRLQADTSGYLYFARWITPPTEPRRFDARFFVARVPPRQEALADHAGEVVDFRWDTPARFLEAQARGEIQLPPPTLWHLTDLSQFEDVEDALAWARNRTVIPVRPKLTAIDGVVMIVLPWDPDYAAIPVAEGEPLAPDSPVAGPITRYVLHDGHWVGKSKKR